MLWIQFMSTSFEMFQGSRECHRTPNRRQSITWNNIYFSSRIFISMSLYLRVLLSIVQHWFDNDMLKIKPQADNLNLWWSSLLMSHWNLRVVMMPAFSLLVAVVMTTFFHHWQQSWHYNSWVSVYVNHQALVSSNYAFQQLHFEPLTHWDRDKMDAISQTIFWSAFSWMKMFEFRLKFHWSLFLRVQLTIFQHWFR